MRPIGHCEMGAKCPPQISTFRHSTRIPPNHNITVHTERYQVVGPPARDLG